MPTFIDPLGNKVSLPHSTLHGHIYRRHPELRGRATEIKAAITDPDIITKSKKDGQSLLYFRQRHEPFILMVAASPDKSGLAVRTSFYVLNTSKGDPIIWQKKIST